MQDAINHPCSNFNNRSSEKPVSQNRYWSSGMGD